MGERDPGPIGGCRPGGGRELRPPLRGTRPALCHNARRSTGVQAGGLRLDRGHREHQAQHRGRGGRRGGQQPEPSHDAGPERHRRLVGAVAVGRRRPRRRRVLPAGHQRERVAGPQPRQRCRPLLFRPGAAGRRHRAGYRRDRLVLRAADPGHALRRRRATGRQGHTHLPPQHADVDANREHAVRPLVPGSGDAAGRQGARGQRRHQAHQAHVSGPAGGLGHQRGADRDLRPADWHVD